MEISRDTGVLLYLRHNRRRLYGYPPAPAVTPATVTVTTAATPAQQVTTPGIPAVLTTAVPGGATSLRTAEIPPAGRPYVKTYTFEGSGDYVHTFTTADDRTWVFRMSYPGDGVFLVRLQDANGRDIDILADEDGVFAGTESVWLVAGTYNLDVTADVPWVITMSTA